MKLKKLVFPLVVLVLLAVGCGEPTRPSQPCVPDVRVDSLQADTLHMTFTTC